MKSTHLSAAQAAAFVKPARILVAVDLDDYEYLLPHAIAQAKASGAHLTLIHAIRGGSAFPMETGFAPYIDRDDADRTVQLGLEKIARQVEQEGIPCDVAFEHGFVAEVIRAKINSIGATRLIMGSHGRGRWGQLVLGSVANELLGSISIPIFVVGPQALAAKEHALPQRMLHPVSLHGDYQRTLDVALALAETYAARLTLLHVLSHDVEEGVNPERTLTWANNALLALIPEDKRATGLIEAKVVCGNVVDGILHVATDLQPDWIILGVDGRFPYVPFQHSNAYKVLTSAPGPVFTVRHAAQEVAEPATSGMHLSAAL
jgi:nucleotide-binding universal stress UspA family protein